MGVDAADTHGIAAGAVHHAVTHLHLTAKDGAGDDRALAGQGEHTVDGEAEHAVMLALCQVLCLLPQVLAQRGHARVIGVGGRGGKHGGACQRGVGQQRGYLVAHGL